MIIFSFCNFLYTDVINLASFTYTMSKKDDLNSMTIQQKILSWLTSFQDTVLSDRIKDQISIPCFLLC